MRWLKTKQVRDRVLFTIFIVAVFYVGTLIPLPYIKFDNSRQIGGLSALLNLSTGGSLTKFGLLALGISPYISASIIIQLLQKSIPSLKRLSEQGMVGRTKLAQITRVVSVFFALTGSIGLLYSTRMAAALGVILPTATSKRIMLIYLMVVGSLFATWLGERIDEKGIGQGASVLITFGILSRVPSQIMNIVSAKANYTGNMKEYGLIIAGIVGIFVVLSIFCIVANNKEYHYPMQMMTNEYRIEAHYFPVKLLASSVMPIIFATAFLTIFSTISIMFNKNWEWVNYSTNKGVIVYSGMIMLFSFIYNYIQVDGFEIQDSFTKGGTYFIGVPQLQTEQFVNKNMLGITLKGAPVLTAIAVVAILVDRFVPSVFGMSLTGISVLIVIGVFQEIIHQIKGLTGKHNYKPIF